MLQYPINSFLSKWIITFFIGMMITLTHSSEVVLQSIDNLDNDEFHSDEGNYVKLIKLDQGCKIEARFFYFLWKHIVPVFFPK